ncbi:MAG: META domain-containing protein [Desulfovibrionaceae bacterium]|nr:META domain-containing protein [Desulfovibrionaceae bacterium]
MKLFTLAAVCLIFCAGCGFPAPSAQNILNELNGRSFQLLTVNGAPSALSAEEPAPTLTFSSEGAVAGHICNSFNGAVQMKNNLMYAPELAVTMRICSDEQLNALETKFFQLLNCGVKIDFNRESEILILEADKIKLEYILIN